MRWDLQAKSGNPSNTALFGLTLHSVNSASCVYFVLTVPKILQSFDKLLRDLNRRGLTVLTKQTANSGDLSIRNSLAFAVELKTVRHAARANPFNRQFDVDPIFKPDRQSIIARRVDTRPAIGLAVDFMNNAQSEMPQKLVLGLLHVDEEIRKVNDASGIGIPELNSAAVIEGSRHPASGRESFRWR